MLTFDRPSPGAADPESVSVGAEGPSPASDVAAEAETGEEKPASPDRSAEGTDRWSPAARDQA
jgi:hypothetical protein